MLTIQDLAMTICVLSEELSPAEYLRNRKWPYIVGLTVTVGYLGVLLGMMFTTPKESNHMIVLVVNLAGYSIQGIAYTFTVFYCLLPALNKLDQMTVERRNILCQFYVFFWAILFKLCVLIAALALSLQDESMTPNMWLMCLSAFYVLTSLGPGFYMLHSHHVTFKAFYYSLLASENYQQDGKSPVQSGGRSTMVSHE